MNIAIIFAGGTGIRMRSRGLPKQFLEVHGKPIISYTIENFERNRHIESIIVVCLESYIKRMKCIAVQAGFTKIVDVIAGGTTGQESIYNGLCFARKIFSLNDIVLIHDGVRPLISDDLITQCIKTTQKFGNAITVSPAMETIVTIDEEGINYAIFNRDQCFHAKAPQTFFLKDILSAHERAIKDGYIGAIDSASLMKYYNMPLHFVRNDANNIKITTPADFYIFRALLEAKENVQILGV